MANEYLKRTPTSTGNRKVFTWAGWVKKQDDNTLNSTRFDLFNAYQGTSGYEDEIGFRLDSLRILYYDPVYTNPAVIDTNSKHKDVSGWMHVLVAIDTTQSTESDRWKIYINGVLLAVTEDGSGYPAINKETAAFNVSGKEHNLLRRNYGTGANYGKGQSFDVFFVDGQALTPDVFGYYKKGDGYISAGSTQATDFKKGQWVPKAPKVIKSVINARGGFGVNGFYLPMNDSTNVGADLHCAPNSIITLKGEDEPQPYYGAPTTTDAYVSQLRTDPYKDNLVVAVPGIINGQGSGYGDYSADIKGSGTNKTVTANGSAGIAVTASYYGSAMVFDGNDDNFDVASSGDDYLIGQNDFTIEGWYYSVSHASTGHHKRVWYLGGELNDSISLNIHGTDADLEYRYNDGVVLTSGITIPTGQWVHIVLERYNRRSYIYVNGKISANGSDTNYLDYTSYNFRIGQNASTNANGPASSLFGYAQDVRFYNGVAKYKGVGFDIVKPYTPVGIGTWRAVPDTTANNFATLNGTSIPSKYTITEGNLRFTNSTTNWTGYLEGTVGFSTGKWYWETRADVDTDYHHIGIVGVGITHFNTSDSYFYGMSYQTDGRFWSEGNVGGAFATGKTQANDGDVVQVAVDMNDKKMWVGINGNWIDSGNPIAGTGENFDSTRGFNYQHYVPFYDSYGSSGLSINFGQNPTFGGKRTAGTNTDDNGRGLFSYDVPTGFLALCEDNLPTPAIADPGKHFKTVLYTGDGNSGRSITGLGFQPDFIWQKERNSTSWHNLVDSVRGSTNRLYSNATNTEASVTNSFTSFNSDGFSIGDDGGTNQSGINNVAWCWKAGGAAVANTTGDINSLVSVNQDAGFSIVSYDGSGNVSDTVGHGLEKTPSFILLKARTQAYYWRVYHSVYGTSPTQGLLLGDSPTSQTGSYNHDTHGGIASLTPTTFGFGPSGTPALTGVNKSGDTYIAYCWAEIEGFSKFGSYVGNLNADGPFVYCGFKPAWVLIKRIDDTGSWGIWNSSVDSTNPSFRYLLPNDSGVEQTGNTHALDFLSNGFKIRNDQTFTNASGGSYIFAAFAESPFTTANAK